MHQRHTTSSDHFGWPVGDSRPFAHAYKLDPANGHPSAASTSQPRQHQQPASAPASKALPPNLFGTPVQLLHPPTPARPRAAVDAAHHAATAAAPHTPAKTKAAPTTPAVAPVRAPSALVTTPFASIAALEHAATVDQARRAQQQRAKTVDATLRSMTPAQRAALERRQQTHDAQIAAARKGALAAPMVLTPSAKHEYYAAHGTPQQQEAALQQRYYDKHGIRLENGKPYAARFDGDAKTVQLDRAGHASHVTDPTTGKRTPVVRDEHIEISLGGARTTTNTWSTPPASNTKIHEQHSETVHTTQDGSVVGRRVATARTQPVTGGGTQTITTDQRFRHGALRFDSAGLQVDTGRTTTRRVDTTLLGADGLRARSFSTTTHEQPVAGGVLHESRKTVTQYAGGTPRRMHEVARTEQHGVDAAGMPTSSSQRVATTTDNAGKPIAFAADGTPIGRNVAVAVDRTTVTTDAHDATKRTRVVQRGAGSDRALGDLQWTSARITRTDFDTGMHGVHTRDATDYTAAELDANGFPAAGATGTAVSSLHVDHRSWWNRNKHAISTGLMLGGTVLSFIPLTAPLGMAMVGAGAVINASDDIPNLIHHPSWQGALAVTMDGVSVIPGAAVAADLAAGARTAAVLGVANDSSLARGLATSSNALTRANQVLAAPLAGGGRLAGLTSTYGVLGATQLGVQTSGDVGKLRHGTFGWSDAASLALGVGLTGAALRGGATTAASETTAPLAPPASTVATHAAAFEAPQLPAAAVPRATPAPVHRSAPARTIPEGPLTDPAVLKAVYSGTYGDKGLTATARDVTTFTESARGITYHMVTGDITTPAGRTVGTFARRVSSDGRVVKHGELKIRDEQLHGSGFAREMDAHLQQVYAAKGVQRVDLVAEQKGGYAWAKLGFELDKPAGAPRAARATQLVDDALAEGRITQAEHDSLAPRLFAGGALEPGTIGGVQDIVALGALGKRILVDSAWSGTRAVTQPAALPRATASLDTAQNLFVAPDGTHAHFTGVDAAGNVTYRPAGASASAPPRTASVDDVLVADPDLVLGQRVSATIAGVRNDDWIVARNPTTGDIGLRRGAGGVVPLTEPQLRTVVAEHRDQLRDAAFAPPSGAASLDKPSLRSTRGRRQSSGTGIPISIGEGALTMGGANGGALAIVHHDPARGFLLQPESTLGAASGTPTWVTPQAFAAKVDGTIFRTEDPAGLPVRVDGTTVRAAGIALQGGDVVVTPASGQAPVRVARGDFFQHNELHVGQPAAGSAAAQTLAKTGAKYVFFDGANGDRYIGSDTHLPADAAQRARVETALRHARRADKGTALVMRGGTNATNAPLNIVLDAPTTRAAAMLHEANTMLLAPGNEQDAATLSHEIAHRRLMSSVGVPELKANAEGFAINEAIAMGTEYALHDPAAIRAQYSFLQRRNFPIRTVRDARAEAAQVRADSLANGADPSKPTSPYSGLYAYKAAEAVLQPMFRIAQLRTAPAAGQPPVSRTDLVRLWRQTLDVELKQVPGSADGLVLEDFGVATSAAAAKVFADRPEVAASIDAILVDHGYLQGTRQTRQPLDASSTPAGPEHVPLPSPPQGGFLDAQRVWGVRGNRKIWSSSNGKSYYTWDGNHGGEIEAYTRRGKKLVHVGVLDPLTGNQTKPRVVGRSVSL